MLLLMWLAGCLLVALASAALSQADAPWLLGLAALMAAQAAVLAGRAARLPALVTWPVGLGCRHRVRGRLRPHRSWPLRRPGGAADADRGQVRRALVRVVAVPARGGCGGPRSDRPRLRARPARAVAAHGREHLGGADAGSSRRLAHVARALVPYLRLTDAVVRVAADGVAVVLPGADERVAMSVLGRMPAPERGDLLLGTATFPDDGQTYALLKERGPVAQAAVGERRTGPARTDTRARPEPAGADGGRPAGCAGRDAHA